jgi:S1-C subfamily serine protease
LNKLFVRVDLEAAISRADNSLALLFVVSDARAESEIPDLIESTLPSVVKIQAFGASSEDEVANGAGFLIDATRGLIVTNSHVVPQDSTIKVTLASSQVLETNKVYRDKDTDIAVLEVGENHFKDVSPLVFAQNRYLRAGQVVIAVGSPFGYSGSVSQGK